MYFSRQDFADAMITFFESVRLPLKVGHEADLIVLAPNLNGLPIWFAVTDNDAILNGEIELTDKLSRNEISECLMFCNLLNLTGEPISVAFNMVQSKIKFKLKLSIRTADPSLLFLSLVQLKCSYPVLLKTFEQVVYGRVSAGQALQDYLDQIDKLEPAGKLYWVPRENQ